jgi:hypothetical protein
VVVVDATVVVVVAAAVVVVVPEAAVVVVDAATVVVVTPELAPLPDELPPPPQPDRITADKPKVRHCFV